MPELLWSDEKDEQLLARHGVGFEAVAQAAQEGRVLADVPHHNSDRYPHQRLLVVDIDGYAWVCPYVRDGDAAFLKTLYPSRDYTALYLRRN